MRKRNTVKTIPFLLMIFLPFLAQAQFTGSEKGGGLTVIVTDGTFNSKHAPQRKPGGKFTDPIRPIGMMEAIQAGAFVERPDFGKAGFILIFCVNDSVGGKQGTLVVNGEEYKGIYRLIRQKMSVDEEIPPGMAPYRLGGTVFFLGIS
jgi:hypothetical protein